MFERGFCDFLECRICDFLEKSTVAELKGFWCDGVIFEAMLGDETALFTAFVGKTGQERYQLFLQLGETSSKLCAEGRSIQPCVPKADQSDAFSVDEARKQIQMCLI